MIQHAKLRGSLGAFVPAGRAGAPTAIGPGVQVATPDVGGLPLLENTCTSDGRLIWSGGAWRVMSPDDDPNKVCVARAAYDWKAVSQIPNHPIRVGPFPVDSAVFAGNPVVSTFENPDQIQPGWGAAIAQLALAAKIQSNAGFNPAPIPCASAGNPGGTVTQGIDANGFPVHSIVYPNNPSPFAYYTACDWLEAFQPGLSTQLSYGKGGLLIGTDVPRDGNDWSGLAGMFDKFNDFWADPGRWPAPLAKFINPATGDTWGLWVSLSLDVPRTQDASLPVGAWDVKADRPNGVYLEVGMAPLPTQNWLHDLWDAIMWIPSHLAEAADWIVGNLYAALQHLACSDPAKAAAIAKGNPAVQAALAALQMTCNKPSLPDCTDPRNINNPICKAKLPTPWYKQWYVIAGALVVGGLLLFRQPPAKAAG